MKNYLMPQMKSWIEENPITYKKAQLKTKLTKLKRKQNITPSEDTARQINELTIQYNRLK